MTSETIEGSARSSASANPPPNGGGRKIVGRPFPPGVSGNPLGRPKVEPRVRRYARRYDRRMCRVLAEIAQDAKVPAAERRRAAMDLVAIGSGRPATTQEVLGRGGEPLSPLVQLNFPQPTAAEEALELWRSASVPARRPAIEVEAQPAEPAAADASPEEAQPLTEEYGSPAPRETAAEAPAPPNQQPAEAPPPAPAPEQPMPAEVARVFGSLAFEGCDRASVRRRAEATVRARFKQEAQLERSMGRPARADELLGELAGMGLE